MFTTQFDPLEPGALREINKISGDSITPFSLQSTPISRFRWDGITYICGTNRDMPFARPCHISHGICSRKDIRIRGTMMTHFQLNHITSQTVLGLPPIAIGAFIGVKVGTIILPLKGSAWGGALGALIGLVMGNELGRRNLECDRGNIWIVVHRGGITLTYDKLRRILPILPIIPPPILLVTLLPRFIRLGRLNVWDVCPHIVPIPAWRDS